MAQAPRLVVRTAQGQREFDVDRVVVGRELDCDVVLADPRVSRHHLVLARLDGRWSATDHSSAGTFAGAQRVDQQPVGTDPTALFLGDPAGERIEVWVTAAPVVAPPPPYTPPAAPDGLLPRTAADRPLPPPTGGSPPHAGAAQPVLPPGQLRHGMTLFPAGAGHGAPLTIGRDPSNAIMLEDPLVSRFHARLELGPVAVIHDHGSFNGVHVGGVRVQGAARLDPGVVRAHLGAPTRRELHPREPQPPVTVSACRG